jgi:uncharacterized membrane protein YkvA (DUF1232 family)
MQLMKPSETRLSRKWWLLVWAVVVIGLCTTPPTIALAAVRVEFSNVQFGLNGAAAAAPGMEGHVHRMITRTERLTVRLATAISGAAVAWSWILPSAVLFLLVSAVASATDLRMLDVRQQSPQVSARDLGHGVRIFFRILRDRRTPYLPRAVLVSALLYWLLPADLVGDGRHVVGMLDDLLITVLAAKLFIHLCPDTVVAAHAEAVRPEV